MNAKQNGAEPAMPIPAFTDLGGNLNWPVCGLTKRELAAFMIMTGSGLKGAQADKAADETVAATIAKTAVRRADALLAELERSRS